MCGDNGQQWWRRWLRWCDAVLVANYPRMSSDHSTETNQIRNGFPSDPGPGEPEAAARSPASSSDLPLACRHRVRRDVVLFADTSLQSKNHEAPERLVDQALLSQSRS